MEEVKNIIEFAIDECTVNVDTGDRPIIDKDKFLDLMEDIIGRRERALKHRINKEAKEAIATVLKNI